MILNRLIAHQFLGFIVAHVHLLKCKMVVTTNAHFASQRLHVVKAEAVRLVSESGRPVAQRAREWDIPDNVRYR